MLPFWAERIRCYVPLVKNGSDVFGAKLLFLASTSCMKIFRATFRAVSFQDLHWLQMLGSGKAPMAVVSRCGQGLTGTHMRLY